MPYTIRSTRRAPLALAAFATMVAGGLSGCATGDYADYPSLERRAVEQPRGGRQAIERQANVVAGVPATPPVPALVTATLAEAIRGLARDADGGETAFRAALANGRGVIAGGRGAAVGSESWSLAQMALSRIDAARGPTGTALAELDRLTLDAENGGDAAGRVALGSEQARVAGLVAAQQAAIDGLARDLLQ